MPDLIRDGIVFIRTGAMSQFSALLARDAVAHAGNANLVIIVVFWRIVPPRQVLSIGGAVVLATDSAAHIARRQFGMFVFLG